MPDMDLIIDRHLYVVPTLLEIARNYVTEEQSKYVDECLLTMNSDQKELFEVVRELVESTTINLNDSSDSSSSVSEEEYCQKKIIWFDAFGGTGKTFLANAILALSRSLDKVALAVSSSGISATLLTDGVTAHARLKI